MEGEDFNNTRIIRNDLLEDKVEKGALVQVLPEWNVEGNDLWLAYPSRKLNSPALMSYIDFAMQFDEVKRYYVDK